MALLPKTWFPVVCVALYLLVTPICNSVTDFKRNAFGLPACLNNNSGNGSCISNDPQMKIIYSTQNEIISVESQGTVPTVLKTSPSGIPRFLTVDARNNTVFWSDYVVYEEAIYKTVLGHNSDETPRIFADSNVFTPAGVAFDWITNNLYILDTNLTQIAVCMQNPTKCAVIFRDSSSRPMDIALHPNEGVMFWTDIGADAGIKKSCMNGRDTETIITASNNSLIHGLAVDEHNSRLYWTDLGTRTVESSNFDGTDPKTIITSVDAFDVEILGDWIFWSDSTTRKIMSANKLTGTNKTEILSDNSATSFAGFSIMHTAKQPIKRANPCKNSNCSYICALANLEATCLCPLGMLRNSTKCYSDINEPTLVLAHMNKILTLELLDLVGDDIFTEIRPPTQITQINAIVGNPINMTLIISDASLKQIVEFTPSIDQSNNYSVLVDGIVNVTHIAIDVVSENIIWVDQGKGTLEVLSLQTHRKKVILSNVSNVHDITFASDSMALFLSKTGENGFEDIVKIFLGGRTRQTILPTYHQYTNPIQLFYNPFNNDLNFAVVNNTDLIINGFSNGSTEFATGTYPNDAAIDFVRFLHKIFWTDDTPNLKVLTGNGEEWCRHKIRIQGNSTNDFRGRKLLTLLNKNMEHLDYLRANHDCSPLNPNGKKCEHICLSVGINMLGECSCETGYDLEVNLVSCSKKADNIEQPVIEAENTDKTVSNGFWIILTVLCMILGISLTYLVVFWWKTHRLPNFVTQPYARFFQS